MVGIRWAFTRETIKGRRRKARGAIESRSIELSVEPVWHGFDNMGSLGQPGGVHDSWRRVHLLNVTHADVFSCRAAVFGEGLENGGHVGMKFERLVLLDRHVVDR